MTNMLTQYSLTLGEYTDLRKLQLQYMKCKDQNQQLLIKLKDVEMLYQDAINKLNQKKKIKDVQMKDKVNMQTERQRQKKLIVKELNDTLSILKSVSGQKFKNIDERNSILQIVKKMKIQIQEMSSQFLKAKQTIKQILSQSQQKQKKWAQRQDNFSNQVADLQLDFQELQKVYTQLQLQNQKVVRENSQLIAQIRSYKTIALEARNQKQRSPIKTLPNELSADFNQQDKDFAADLLSYQKQLLVRVYELVMQSFQKDDIGLCFKKIYQAYEDVTQCFRQKLQIQYDLSDLQCQYQKRKGTTSAKDMLIQLRKQINNFRKQLFNQKQLLHKHQQILQERVKDLSGQAVHDNRLKNFTINLQTKLRRQKTNKTEQNELHSLNDYKKMSTIQFKPSLDTNQIVKQMLQKDRQNLQNMLKQTRNHFRK